jgi:hypothetical protein
MSRPLRSAPITGASPLLQAGPPARAATVLSTSPFQRLGALPLAPATLRAQYQRGLPVFPHASRRPGSRHLHAGHRLASRRVSARLIPGRALSPRFRCRFILSALQRWFTRVRLPGPRLTALTPPSARGYLRGATRGWPPCSLGFGHGKPSARPDHLHMVRECRV